MKTFHLDPQCRFPGKNTVWSKNYLVNSYQNYKTLLKKPSFQHSIFEKISFLDD